MSIFPHDLVNIKHNLILGSDLRISINRNMNIIPDPATIDNSICRSCLH